ncbi:MAG: hypothetical protein ACYS9X_01335 [Planctomycetota bacterium]|jgi:hypothetical protein
MDWVDEAVLRNRLLGTREFYVPQRQLLELVRRVLASSARPHVSMNRPHTRGRGLVHNVEWRGLKFISVTTRPIVLA